MIWIGIHEFNLNQKFSILTYPFTKIYTILIHITNEPSQSGKFHPTRQHHYFACEFRAFQIPTLNQRGQKGFLNQALNWNRKKGDFVDRLHVLVCKKNEKHFWIPFWMIFSILLRMCFFYQYLSFSYEI